MHEHMHRYMHMDYSRLQTPPTLIINSSPMRLITAAAPDTTSTWVLGILGRSFAKNTGRKEMDIGKMVRADKPHSACRSRDEGVA